MNIAETDNHSQNPGSQFGSLLKRLRIAANMSQIELADRSGLSRNGLSDLERGARSYPRQETISLIAEALKLNPKQRQALDEAAKRNRSDAGHQANLRDIEPALSMLPLIGRENEQAGISRFFDAPRRRLLAIGGETGIGKSRILFEAAQTAQAAGWQVMAARCHRWSASEAYAPFVDLLENDIARRKEGFHAQTLEQFPILQRVIPLKNGITASLQDLPDQKGDLARRSLFSAVAAYCAKIAGPAGTLLLLDDMHWAGDEAIQLLQFLLRSESVPPVAVAVAYRTGDSGPSQSLRDLVADCERQSICQSLALDRLQASDSFELYQATIEEAKAVPATGNAVRPATGNAASSKPGSTSPATIQGLTGGIPYYIISCAQSTLLGDGPDAYVSMMECLKQRVTGLQKPAQDVLGILSVNGGDLSHSLLLKSFVALGWSEKDGIAVLDDLYHRELLRDDGYANYGFVQELMREIVFSGLSPARRALFHKTIAETLEAYQPFAGVEKLAFHFEAAHQPEKAAHYMEAAAKRAQSLFAYTEAREYFRRALLIRDAAGPEERGAAIRSELVSVLMILGEYEDALAHIETALGALRRQHKIPEQTIFYSRLMECLIRQGKFDEALRRGSSFANVIADAPPSSELAVFLTGLAYAYYLNKDFSAQIETINRAEAVALEVQKPLTNLRVFEGKALALISQSKYRESADMVIRKVLPTAQALGDTHKFAVSSLNLASTLLMLGSYEELREILDRAEPVIADLQDGRVLGFATMLRLNLEYESGNWQKAMEHGTRILENKTGTLGFAADITLELARIDALQGKTGAALSKISQSKELGPTTGNYELLPAILFAEIELLNGNAAQALEHLAILDREPWNDHPGMFDWDALKACAAVLSGRSGLADADKAVGGARETGLLPSLSDTLRFRGWIHLTQGNIEAATVDLEEALAIENLLKRGYNKARILFLCAMVSKALNNDEAAARRLEEAQTLCAGLGERVCLPLIRKFRESGLSGY